MITDAPSSIVPNRSIALLIDADNVSHTKIAMILAELSKHGTANIRRAYGDWASQTLKGWKEKLHEFAIRPIQQFSYSTGKNATDIALVIDAMELLYTQKPDAFCLASSDADFTPLVMQLKANSHEVYGFGERKTPIPFVAACTTFLFLDNQEEGTSTIAHDEIVTHEAGEPEPSGPSFDVAKAFAAKNPSRPLSQDTKLVTILRGAVEATAREDGWASMAAAGSAAKRQAPIDPRNYGSRNFAALFAATGLFEIVKVEGSHSFVADRRTATARPLPSE